MTVTLSVILRIIAVVLFFFAILAPIVHSPVDLVAAGLFAWCLSTLTP